jgi:hypothetical protein
MNHRDLLLQLSKEELIGLLENAAKNWLAHVRLGVYAG